MPPLSESGSSAQAAAEAGCAGLVVVHADAHLLVLDKPAGLLSVPGRGADKQDCLAARAQAVFADALIVHRLDMATSGLLLMARGADMQRALSDAFARRQVHKQYLGVVHGRPQAPAADGQRAQRLADAASSGTPADLEPAGEDGWQTIHMPLGPDWPNRPRSKVDWQHGRPSVTHWRLLSHDATSDTARVALQPVTGRSHQLRLHLQAIGHQIVGDTLYGPQAGSADSPTPAGTAPDRPAGMQRLLLHATRLAFVHPANGQPMTFESPAPF